MQKDDSNSSAGAVDDSELKDQDMQVSQHSIKPNVVGSQCHGTLKENLAAIKKSFEYKINQCRANHFVGGNGLTLLNLSGNNEIKIGFAIDHSMLKSIS